MAVWIEQYGSRTDPLPGPGQSASTWMTTPAWLAIANASAGITALILLPCRDIAKGSFGQGGPG
jgi:hypothetical protein